ncbi:hypothetical protein TNCT_377841 [Trichonephila clavata]|uniref:Uncharacterized protein n=1 Tax=Trichonephila clavata TaxID=2740835 RepID=A0A8X6FXK5_TRICU|nr:hypothetical protein TNCT_377841 [Trichonephila clavata]
MVLRNVAVMKFGRNQYGLIHEYTLQDHRKQKISALYDEIVKQNVDKRNYYEAVAPNWMEMQVSCHVG